MPETRCQNCGRPLPPRAGKPGRTSLYCSAACRQQAYRSRHTPTTSGETVPTLLAGIRQQVQELALQPPEAFYTDVTSLSSSVGRLRRIARVARDAAETGVTEPAPPEETGAEIVTPSPVTEPTAEAKGTQPGAGEDAATVTAVRSGDEATFAGLMEPHRRELQVHCYRMVASYDDAEDLIQETFLRAWRRRDGFQGRSTFRAWLYRIATNTCLDFLRRTQRRPQRYEPIPGMDHGGGEPPSRVTWLQPYPSQLLEDVASSELEPDTAAVSRETIELVFLAAIQHLPPRQRAVLILRDVLEWSAADTATLLDMSVASVNSALQRARPTMREHLPRRRADWVTPVRPTEEERALLRRYMDAVGRLDLGVMAELLHEDVRVTMPPNPFWFTGRSAFASFVAQSLDPAAPGFFGKWRHLPTSANGQLAAGGYVQRPGTRVYRAQVLDVLRIEGGKVAEITAFEPHLFPAFGLPLTLSDDPPEDAATDR